jgi:pimeloyl-ACP methyl ester carboxylesterase
MANSQASLQVQRESIAGIDLEVIRGGLGRPLLALHGFQTIDPSAPFLAELAAHASIIAPSHPGFGDSARPADFETMYDLVHFYLDLLDTLPDERIDVIGFSFGGWLAAELAIKAGHRMNRLVLVDSVGIKVSDRETPDIFDVFNQHPEESIRRSWHDPARWRPPYDAMTDEQIVRIARNREALCLYAWHPYLHNPHLKRWLHRVRVPTVVLWGASDRIVLPSYGEAFARLIPGARFELIAAAGHHPEIEQAGAFVERVGAFLQR